MKTTLSSFIKKIIIFSLISFSIIPNTNAQNTIWGMTKFGGNNNDGVILEYNPGLDQFVKKFDFDNTVSGKNPDGDLIRATNQKFYGLTRTGGSSSNGVLFEFDPTTNGYTKKLDFDNLNTGRSPYGTLILSSYNWKLYGMTQSGGANDKGVIFEYDHSTDTYTKIHDFDGILTGSNPYGNLVEASNGKLFGMTYTGGTNDEGVIFEYDLTTSSFTKKMDFDSLTSGMNPYNSFMEASNGKLYGMTKNGGTSNFGVLFEYMPSSNTYTKILDFDGANSGKGPTGNLLEGDNGKIYGFTRNGGTTNQGVLFEYDYTSSIYNVKVHFDGTNMGSVPCGTPMKMPGGKLYGMARNGGTSNTGTLFEYNYNTNILTKRRDLSGANFGQSPYGSLMELIFCYPPAGSETTTSCDSFTWSANGNTYTSTGSYNAIVVNSLGCDSTVTLDLTITTSSTGSETVSSCGNYFWPTSQLTYIATGNYSETLVAANGCDSVVTLDLIIYPEPTGTITETVCYGESIVVNGTTYNTTVSGATEVFTNVGPNGCDSIVTINLTVENAVDVSVTDNSSTLIANATGASYFWLDCNNNYQYIPFQSMQTYSVITNGNYAVEVTVNGCIDTSSCTNIINVGISEINVHPISIHPNPTLGNVTIQLENSFNEIQIDLKNITGQIISTSNYSNTDSIDLKIKGESGIYFVEVSTDTENKQIFKIVKK